MSKIANRAAALGEKIAPELGIEIIHTEFVKEGAMRFLRFYIDTPNGVSTQECEAFSRAINPLLDEEDFIEGQYYLEVSSPGINRPIRKKEEYDKYKGRQAAVALFTNVEGRKKFKAVIKGLDEAGLSVIFSDEAGEFSIPLEKISKATLDEEV